MDMKAIGSQMRHNADWGGLMLANACFEKMVKHRARAVVKADVLYWMISNCSPQVKGDGDIPRMKSCFDGNGALWALSARWSRRAEVAGVMLTCAEGI